MEAHARAQHARLQLARALSAPAAPLDAVLQGMPALAGVAPTTAALAGAPDPQAHHVLALLLQEQQRQLQGQAQLQLQLQQQHHQRQQQRQQELLLAQLHTGPGPAVQRAASLPTLLAEPLPAGSALSAHVAFPSAAASTMAVAEGPPSIEQQPSGTFEEHWRRLDTAWREAREADQEAWQQLRAKQWREVMGWWHEGAARWQAQRREQEESWKRCEAQQRANWEFAELWQGRQVQQAQQQARQVQRQAEQQAQQAQQAQARQLHLELPHPAEQVLQVQQLLQQAEVQGRQAALERQRSGSAGTPLASDAHSSGMAPSSSSGRASEQRPAKRHAGAAQWGWDSEDQAVLPIPSLAPPRPPASKAGWPAAPSTHAADAVPPGDQSTHSSQPAVTWQQLLQPAQAAQQPHQPEKAGGPAVGPPLSAKDQQLHQGRQAAAIQELPSAAGLPASGSPPPLPVGGPGGLNLGSWLDWLDA